MNNVLFRAQINATSTANSSELLSYVSQWVTNRDTTLIVAGTRLSLDMECPVYIRSFKDDPCSTSQLDNATQAYPTPQTAGRVPTTSCPPTNATKGSDGVTAPVPGGAAGYTVTSANGGIGDSWSNGVGITLVVLGSLILIVGVVLLVAALIIFGKAKSKKNQDYQR